MVCTVTETVVLLLAATVPRFQVMTLPTSVPPAGLATIVIPAARVSTKVTLVASASPLLVTVRVR